MSAADVALITSIELQHRERKPYQYFTNDENGRPKLFLFRRATFMNN